jgi:osmoprotectant transport system substrate-binding protein
MTRQRGRSRAAALILGLALAMPGCVSTGRMRADLEIPARSDNIVIGAFNFSESRVLAEVYRQALELNGFETDVLSDVGPREVIEPALEQHQIDMAIEYLGAALTFLDPDALQEERDVERAYRLLEQAFSTRGVQTLPPAPGENRNEFVVTAETAQEHGLRTLTDLQRVDSEFVFGGPPECAARPLCLQGLERTYQLEFASFIPLDSGGPQTVATLEGGEVDVALLFTTNPAIGPGRLIALRDDRHLQPPENILPVVREEVLEEQGDALVTTLNMVTRRLTTAELRTLNAMVDLQLKTPEDAASEWLTKQGIT